MSKDWSSGHTRSQGLGTDNNSCTSFSPKREFSQRDLQEELQKEYEDAVAVEKYTQTLDSAQLHKARTAGLNWWSHFDRFVIREGRPQRQVMTFALGLALFWTGTVVPYAVCFLDFHIPSEMERPLFIDVVGVVVDIIFIADLFSLFFFSFRDRKHREVVEFKRIFFHYIQGYFLLNMVACIPEVLVEAFLDMVGLDAQERRSAQVNKIMRLMRLKRLTRLTRMWNIRKVKYVIPLWDQPIIRYIVQLRGARILNLIIFLLFLVHLLACGWYLCASFSGQEIETWIYARYTNRAETTVLAEEGAFLQWLYSVYYVLTVFTTVGFGDMYPRTPGEVAYTCFLMVYGAIANSMIVSEVMNVVSSVDQDHAQRTKRKSLMRVFAKHVCLTDEMVMSELIRFVDYSESWCFEFDDSEFRRLVTGGMLPRSIMLQLPNVIYEGKLITNSFIRVVEYYCERMSRQLPPRLPVQIGVMAHQRTFESPEVVYHLMDQPFTIFLVLDGIFAHVGEATESGGTEGASPLHGGAGCEVAAWLTPTRASGGKVRTTSPGKISNTVGLVLRNRFRMRGLTRRRLQSQKSRENAASSDNLEMTKTNSLSRTMTNPPFCEQLTPYRLYQAGDYFGDAEIFCPSQRLGTVRCEKAGSVLVLGKQDIDELCREFSGYGDAWRRAACRRECTRRMRRRRHTFPWSYQEYAAVVIQRWFFSHRKGGRRSRLLVSLEPRGAVGQDKSFSPRTSYQDCKALNSQSKDDSRKLADNGTAHKADPQMSHRSENSMPTVPLEPAAVPPLHAASVWRTFEDERRVPRIIDFNHAPSASDERRNRWQQRSGEK